MPPRDDFVRAARRYIGTPYHHQAALAGAGCDCLGLIRGVWRDLYGAEPEQPPPYTPDWGETGEVEHMLEAASRHMRPVPLAEADAGDVDDLPSPPRCRGQARRHPHEPHVDDPRAIGGPGARGDDERLVDAAGGGGVRVSVNDSG